MGLDEGVYAELDRRLAPVDAARLAAYPGERTGRQPAVSRHHESAVEEVAPASGEPP